MRCIKSTHLTDYCSVAVPTFGSANSTSGPTSGGTIILIRGTNLENVDAVMNDEFKCVIRRKESSSIVCQMSPGVTLSHPFLRAVTSPNLSHDQSAGAQLQWKYEGKHFVPVRRHFNIVSFATDPVISQLLIPHSSEGIPTRGGSLVIVQGSNFGNNCQFVEAFPSKSSDLCSCASVDHTAIHLFLPAGVGTHQLRVRIGNSARVLSSDSFTYNTASIISILPNVGPTTGNTQLLINGTEFGPATATPIVRIGSDTSEYSCTVVEKNFSSIICITSAGLGQNLVVSVEVGSYLSASDGIPNNTWFNYEVPSLDSWISSSSELPTNGGFIISLRGHNLHPLSKIFFNGNEVASNAVDWNEHQVCPFIFCFS
jgi:hypothetical protein